VGAAAEALTGGNIVPCHKGVAGAARGGKIVGGREAVRAVACDGEFVLAHLRLAYRRLVSSARNVYDLRYPLNLSEADG
jgi:hypothetical protein